MPWHTCGSTERHFSLPTMWIAEMECRLSSFVTRAFPGDFALPKTFSRLYPAFHLKPLLTSLTERHH